MIGPYRFEGHAIISDDDRIADASGKMPPALRNDADWRRFQSHLERAAIVVLGRLGHEAHPNRNRRNRLVLSSSAAGIERRSDAWWWNPAKTPLEEALARAAPEGGTVAIPGGQRVFDFFLDVGYDAFHLARAAGAVLGAGPTVFSACRPGLPAEAVLAGRRLVPSPPETLDEAARVSLTVWSAPRTGQPSQEISG